MSILAGKTFNKYECIETGVFQIEYHCENLTS